MGLRLPHASVRMYGIAQLVNIDRSPPLPARVAEGRPTFQAGPSGLTFGQEPGLKGHLLKCNKLDRPQTLLWFRFGLGVLAQRKNLTSPGFELGVLGP